MPSFFGKKRAKEQVKESQKGLAGDIRDLDREIAGLRRDEAALIADIKAAANAGNDASTRILAQQLVRMRGNMQRLQATKAGLQGVGSSLSAAAASTTMAASLGNAGKAMAAVGAHAEPTKVAQQVQEFARQDARQQAASNAVGDALDLALDSDEEEGQAAQLVQQMMDEVGLELAAAMKPAPGGRVAVAPAVPTALPTAAEDDELMLRLAELKS